MKSTNTQARAIAAAAIRFVRANRRYARAIHEGAATIRAQRLDAQRWKQLLDAVDGITRDRAATSRRGAKR